MPYDEATLRNTRAMIARLQDRVAGLEKRANAADVVALKMSEMIAQMSGQIVQLAALVAGYKAAIDNVVVRRN